MPTLAVFTKLPGKVQPNYPIGIDDFRKLRQKQLAYVDKTHLISELLDKPGTEVFLLPRPRRFGKTLNLSMLRYFFARSAEDHAPLFAGLHIWEAGERYRAHFQRYPVLALSFKGLKTDTYQACFAGIRMKLQGLVQEKPSALFCLLVFTGYLKAEKFDRGVGESPGYRLSIPNREVREVYSTTFQQWMEARMRGHEGNLERLTRALLAGDAEGLQEQLQAFVTNLLSFHDTGGLSAEQVYHGFIVGLLAVMEPAYQVRSNREAGQGRPDVTICPRQAGQPGVVLELKVAPVGKKTPQAALAEGAAQLRQMDYAAELRERGAAPIHAFVVALRGKQVWVKKYEAKKPRARRSPPRK